jgi:hypothetical protein
MPKLLSDYIMEALAADDAFARAIVAAGYSSRWDWNKSKDDRPMAAYLAKVAADKAAHEAWELSRKGDVS